MAIARLGEPYIVNIRELFLARQYILQYAAFIYRNDCNMRVAHIAIYCIFKYFAIYCQYIVYCNNISYIATIFKISRQYLVYRDNISRYIAIHSEYIAMLSKVYSATAIYHSSNASSSSSLFGLQYNNIS